MGLYRGSSCLICVVSHMAQHMSVIIYCIIYGQPVPAYSVLLTRQTLLPQQHTNAIMPHVSPVQSPSCIRYGLENARHQSVGSMRCYVQPRRARHCYQAHAISTSPMIIMIMPCDDHMAMQRSHGQVMVTCPLEAWQALVTEMAIQ